MTNDAIYPQHIRDSAARIMSYAAAGEVAFRADTRTQDAIVRNLEVIGEAVKALSETTRSLAPEIPWKQIAGMRDVLIHRYFSVDLDLVWTAVRTDLPTLLAAVARLLARQH